MDSLAARKLKIPKKRNQSSRKHRHRQHQTPRLRLRREGKKAEGEKKRLGVHHKC
jgi:hypothetical protein